MEYIHHPYQPGETIAAISTPPGEGGIAIVRISGTRALDIAESVFSGSVRSYLSHTAHLGYIKDQKGQILDQVLLLIMRAPKSYTGEDTIELHCHGGLLASRKVLEAVCSCGARLASPGEFTFKAFLNGKLDLTQAEAVAKLIGAKSEQAYSLAQAHFKGSFAVKIKTIQKQLFSIAALFEAWVDFPEEGIEFRSQKEVEEELDGLITEMKDIRKTFHEGRKIDEGISLCIAGPPNAGKSSLLNALLDEERAIVTPHPGTTRDLLHEEIVFGGMRFKLTDTAGIRKTDDVIEKEGILRSKQAIEKADLILFVLDAHDQNLEESLLEPLPKEKTVVIWNKMDLPLAQTKEIAFPYTVSVSALARSGLEKLKQKIQDVLWKNGLPEKDEVIISSLRHFEALSKAVLALDKVLDNLKNQVSPEFLTSDLRTALSELGKIHGTHVTESILSSIFSQFCVGK